MLITHSPELTAYMRRLMNGPSASIGHRIAMRVWQLGARHHDVHEFLNSFEANQGAAGLAIARKLKRLIEADVDGAQDS